MRFKIPANNYEETITVPFLWAFLFGFVYFAIKGVWIHAIVHLVLVIVAFNVTFPLLLGLGAPVVWLLYALLARRILRSHFLRRGWVEVGA